MYAVALDGGNVVKSAIEDNNTDLWIGYAKYTYIPCKSEKLLSIL